MNFIVGMIREVISLKDEIKEILDRMKDDKRYQGYLLAVTKKEAHLLLDYITNLQETCQNAINQSIIDHKYASKKEDEVIVLQEENKELKDKKSVKYGSKDS